jgi:hypothetical protein
MMANLKHELWIDPEGLETFCLAGPKGEAARKLLPPGSKLVWTVEAGSHFEAMSKYYAHKGWGKYESDQPWDFEPYPEEWLKDQQE